MSSKVTAVVFTDNNLEGADITYKSLESFGGELLDEVIVYNYSEDDETAGEASFFDKCTYIKCSKDNRFEGFPKAINKLIKEMHKDNDILVLCKNMMVVPEYVSRLKLLLDNYDKAAIAVGYTNGFRGNQALPGDIHTYQEAAAYVLNGENRKCHRITLGKHLAFMLKRDAFLKVGGFNEEMYTLRDSLTDYYFSVTLARYNIVADSKAVIWNSAPDAYEPAYDVQYWEHDFNILSNEKGLGYYNSGGNAVIIGLIERNEDEAFKVLEVGCSKGDTLLEIKEKYQNSEVYGAELDENAANLAANFCEVICANVEDESLPYKEGEFDYIILADVLEHLHNPQKSLEYLKRFLKPGGSVLASIPNVQHISVVRDLMSGNFTYTPVGLLDHTHIHLFTWKEIARMFHDTGFNVGDIHFTMSHISEEERRLIEKLLKLVDGSERFMYEAFQYVFKAEKI